MKTQTYILILLVFTQTITAQIGNDKTIIVKNKVKSSFEKHCFSGSNSGCTAIWEKYDEKGNSIEWNMGRLGSIYRNIYDRKNNKIFTLWVDKTDSTKIDTIAYVYDKRNKIIQEGLDTFENFYNQKQQLIKQVSESININENIVRKTKNIHWTSFDKIKTEITTVKILEVKKKTDLDKLRVYYKKYIYDDDNNLSKETHFHNDTLTNTIFYNYDSSNRLVKKREKDISRIETINSMKFGNREDISELITKISYDDNGFIKEKYTYFSDPCMSLDNHFLYKHFYLENGLLKSVDVYEKDYLVFTISYEYEYYE